MPGFLAQTVMRPPATSLAPNAPRSCAEFPSSRAARDLLDGVPGAGWRVLGWTAFRASLISLGALVGGVKDARQNLATGAIGSALVEVAVLAQMLNQRRTQ